MKYEQSHRSDRPLLPPPCLFTDNKKVSSAPHHLEVRAAGAHAAKIEAFLSSYSFQTLDPSFSELSNDGEISTSLSYNLEIDDLDSKKWSPTFTIRDEPLRPTDQNMIACAKKRTL